MEEEKKWKKEKQNKKFSIKKENFTLKKYM